MIAFMMLATATLFHAVNARSRTRSALSSGLFANRWRWGVAAICLALQVATVELPLLREVLRTVPLSLIDWGLVATASLAPVVVVKLVKLVQGLRHLAA